MRYSECYCGEAIEVKPPFCICQNCGEANGFFGNIHYSTGHTKSIASKDQWTQVTEDERWMIPDRDEILATKSQSTLEYQLKNLPEDTKVFLSEILGIFHALERNPQLTREIQEILKPYRRPDTIALINQLNRSHHVRR